MGGVALKGPCPSCREAVEVEGSAAVTCPACASRFHVAVLVVEGFTATKISGVRRHRLRLKARGTADPHTFEGPQGIDLGSGETVALVTKDGRPCALWRGVEAIGLAPSGSDDPLTTGSGPLTGALGSVVWAIAFAMVIAAAACLDLAR